MMLKANKWILPVLFAGVFSLKSAGQQLDMLKPKFNLDIQVQIYNTQELIDLQAIVLKDHDGTLDELSFYDFIRYMKDGKKAFYYESQINHLEFTDFDGKKRLFVSSRYTDIKNARGLWEILYAGKITWYREYYPVGYMNGGGRTTGSRDFFAKEGQEPVSGTRRKKRLLQLTADKPGLTAQIKALKTDADVLEILKAYNN